MSHETESQAVPVEEVRRYVEEMLDGLRARTRPGSAEVDAPVQRVVEAIFRELTSQRFGYLGRTRSEPYRDAVQAHLRRDVERAHPVRFFFDIGPGYHASLEPGTGALHFDVGLAELALLAQVVAFCNAVRPIHAPGAHFHLVIDNLCGVATNDVPLEKSLGYVRDLRSLIEAVGAQDHVALLVESEVSTWEQYAARLEREPQRPSPEVDAGQIENVARFLGRECTAAEAARRVELYRRTGIVTEELLAPAIEGVRLTQRHTAGTLGFRAFPGGDQRIQVGVLALGRGKKGRLRPVLLSSRNAPQYERTLVDVRDCAPAPIRELWWVDEVEPSA